MAASKKRPHRTALICAFAVLSAALMAPLAGRAQATDPPYSPPVAAHPIDAHPIDAHPVDAYPVDEHPADVRSVDVPLVDDHPLDDHQIDYRTSGRPRQCVYRWFHQVCKDVPQVAPR